MAEQDREKRICKNPNHPFKRPWFWYNPKFDEYVFGGGDYCSTCAHYFHLMEMMIYAAMEPSDTLYGNASISMSREQAHALVDNAFDRYGDKEE